jgi:amino acid permease
MHGSAENEWESSARTVSSGRAAFNNESTNDDFLHAHSLINRGGLHLRRMAPMKDLLVPSGPLAGLAGTVFNLSNSTFGAGVLAYGICYLQLGLVLATVLSFLVALAQATANYLLLRAAGKSDARSMPVLAYRNFGLVGSMLLDILLILSTFGCLCAYFILFADFLLPVAASFISPSSILATDRVVTMVFVALVVVLPLSLRTTINSLHTFSLLAVVLFILVVLGIVVICAVGIVQHGASGTLLGKISISSFQGLSIIIFAFANTSALLPIYIEMERPTLQRIMFAQGLSSVVVLLLYVLSGSLAYAYFGSAVQGNMLQNLQNSAVVILMKLSFTVGIATAVYPLTIFPCRLSVEHLLLGVRRQFTSLEFSMVTIIIVAGSFGVAIATTNVDLIFGLVGAIAFSLTCYVFPAIVFLKSVGFARVEGKLTVVGIYWVLTALIIIAFGMTGLVLGILSWVQTL